MNIMPKIRLFRKKDWIIRYRICEVYLNGQKIGYLPNGENLEFDTPAGQHKIKIKMGRYNSRSIDVNLYNKDNRAFLVSRNMAMSAIIFILIPAITFGEIFLRRNFSLERRILESGVSHNEPAHSFF